MDILHLLGLSLLPLMLLAIYLNVKPLIPYIATLAQALNQGLSNFVAIQITHIQRLVTTLNVSDQKYQAHN